MTVSRHNFFRLSGTAALATAMADLRPRLLVAPAAAGLGDESDISRWLQPVPAGAVFKDSDWCIWCGSAVRCDDGKYHLFYFRWPSKLGHQAWVTHSEVARAVADSPTGPYRHADVVLPEREDKFWDGSCTHNPTILSIGKKFCLYYMGNHGDRVVPLTGLNWIHRNHQRIGVALADSPARPMEAFRPPGGRHQRRQ